MVIIRDKKIKKLQEKMAVYRLHEKRMYGQESLKKKETK